MFLSFLLSFEISVALMLFQIEQVVEIIDTFERASSPMFICLFLLFTITTNSASSSVLLLLILLLSRL